MYKQSFYNIIEKNSDGSAVLFNTRTGGVVVAGSTENDKFIKLLDNPNLFSDHDSLKVNLIKYQFLVKNDFDELDLIKKNHEESMDRSSKQILCAIIPTKLCNFGCPYCYIKNPKKTVMDTEVYSKIYNYITRKIKIAKTRFRSETIDLNIEWFGGEPTLKSEKILNFMKELMFLAEVYNVQIKSTIITNGYLLDYKLFEQFVSKKITTFQITLDGSKNIHDQSRYLKTNKQPTFDKIYKNILEIQRRAPSDMDYKIKIRTNVTKSNIAEIETLRKQIKKDFQDRRISHYFSCVHNYSNKSESVYDDAFNSYDSLDQSYSLNMKNTIKYFSDCSVDEMYTGLPRPKNSCCMVHRDDYAILPSGDVVACHAGDPADSIGKLETDGSISFDNDFFDLWKKSIFQCKGPYANCYRCNLLPICMGGCKYSFLYNSSLRCDMTESNIRSLLGAYLSTYLAKAGLFLETKYYGCKTE